MSMHATQASHASKCPELAEHGVPSLSDRTLAIILADQPVTTGIEEAVADEIKGICSMIRDVRPRAPVYVDPCDGHWRTPTVGLFDCDTDLGEQGEWAA